MAQTFTALAQGVTFAAGKVMLALVNTHATEILKVYRAGILNVQTAAVAGVVCQMDVRLYTGAGAWAGGTAVTPVKHDSNNTLPTTYVCSYNSTPAGSNSVLRRVLWSSDEPAASGATIDELECLVPMNIVWDCGYGDTNCLPITLRQNEGFVVYNNSGAAGLADFWFEFTKE